MEEINNNKKIRIEFDETQRDLYMNMGPDLQLKPNQNDINRLGAEYGNALKTVSDNIINHINQKGQIKGEVKSALKYNINMIAEKMPNPELWEQTPNTKKIYIGDRLARLIKAVLNISTPAEAKAILSPLEPFAELFDEDLNGLVEEISEKDITIKM